MPFVPEVLISEVGPRDGLQSVQATMPTAAKLRWLDDHGYGVGNHTTGHTDLRDVDDATFKSTIGDAIDWANAAAPHASADILTMPFGNYPDAAKHPEQVRWLHDEVDEDPALALRYGLHGVPTFVALYQGRTLGRITSWPGSGPFIEAIERLLVRQGLA